MGKDACETMFNFNLCTCIIGDYTCPYFAYFTSEMVNKKELEIIHDALKDVAKKQLSEAAKKIWELGKEVRPVVANTAAYVFLKKMIGM